VVLRYAKMLNGIDSLVVTKMDVFDEQPEIKVCTGYRHKGELLSEMPADVDTLAQIEPEYKTLPGWKKPTPGIRDVRDLPLAARDYLNFISDHLQVEIGMISTGPERDATIVPRGTKLAAWV
jgi:adenylosuccinate synthase